MSILNYITSKLLWVVRRPPDKKYPISMHPVRAIKHATSNPVKLQAAVEDVLGYRLWHKLSYSALIRLIGSLPKPVILSIYRHLTN